MARWEPDAESRLRAAALELFGEIGYEQTTVAGIADRAGLTARTFFRYFTDKREVLFSGSGSLEQLMVAGLAQAPVDASAFDVVAAALIRAGEFLSPERRPISRLRNSVIAANMELRERELIKMATLSTALAQGLRERGIGEPEASLAAEAGIAVFHVAFTRWVGKSEQRSYVEIVNDALARLRALMSN